MEVRGNLPDRPGPNRRYTPKKQSISETNIKPPPPELLENRAKPEADFVELEGGFTMYPSEILEFSDGTDNPT